MKDVERLIELKRMLKKKKPKFVRQEAHRRKKLSDSWRRPRGVHSKLRLRRRGKPARVSIGYGSPAAVRGLTREGLIRRLVFSVSDLKSLAKGEIAELKSGIGNKKKLEILREAKKFDIRFFNVKDIDAAIKSIEEKFAKTKAMKKEKMKKRGKRVEKKKEKKGDKPKETKEKEESK